MDLHDYARAIRRHWVIVLVIAIIGTAVGAVGAIARTPEYESTGESFVSVRAGAQTIDDLSAGATFTQQVVSSYADIATKQYVLDDVIRSLGLKETATSLAKRVTASAPVDEAVIEITVTDPSPRTAAEIANAILARLGSAVTELSPGAGKAAAVITLTQVQSAEPASRPVSPNVAADIALGVLLGLLLGLLVAVLRERLDTRVRDAADAELVASRPVLGKTALDRAGRAHPLVVHDDALSVRAEAFRSLRTNLQFVDFEGPHRSIVITSSIASEGKSTTAANLGVAMAAAGSPVLLIDADLRRPTLAKVFGIDDAVGLTDVLIGTVSLEDALQQWGDTGLVLLPSGPLPPNPSELLQGRSMAELIHALRGRFPTVLLDSPPVLPVSDAAILARLVDGALLVCAAGSTRRPQLRAAVTALEHVGARVLGLVVTMLPLTGTDAGGYGSYGAAAPGPGADGRAGSTAPLNAAQLHPAR